MPRRIVVVGAGVVGSAISAELARGGADVSLLEAGQPARGTSGATFAWVNSNYKVPEHYHRLNVAGMGAHRRFAEKQALEAAWYHSGGNIEWRIDGDEQRQLEQKVSRLRALDYRAEWISRAELMTLEPDLSRDGLPIDGIAYFPNETWVDVPLLVAALLGQARDNGARILPNTPITGFVITGNNIDSVVAGAERFDVDVVVNCAGPEADQVAAMAGVSLPIAKEPGLIVTTEPVAVGIRRIIHAPNVNVRPEGGGRLMLHDSAADASVTNSYAVRPDAVDALLNSVESLFRQAKGLKAESVRVGVRPIPPDRLPVLGFANGVANLYQAVTHSGVTLSVLFGEMVTRHILKDEEAPGMEQYRPDVRI